jgi:hypothetical protein
LRGRRRFTSASSDNATVAIPAGAPSELRVNKSPTRQPPAPKRFGGGASRRYGDGAWSPHFFLAGSK